MTDTNSPPGKDESIASLKEANSIINEFEGKPKDKEPELKLNDGSEMNDAAKRAKLMMANATQQLQAQQQKKIPSPVKRKTPATATATPQQTTRPPAQPPRQQHNIYGDAGVNSNTMAQMLGVLMARVDFLEKDNTKSKELVQRVKTLEISIEKISMIINKLSGKIDLIPKGNSEKTEALIKQVDIMREKFHDSKSLMLRMDKLEKRGASGIPIGVSGIAGNETLLARVATLEENVNTTIDRLMGLRIRTKSVMTRVDCLEEIARSTKSPEDVKNMEKMQHLKSPSNSITNELAMKVDYLEQKLGSIQGGRGVEPKQDPMNHQILMARLEALEEESRRKAGTKQAKPRNQNTSPKANANTPKEPKEKDADYSPKANSNSPNFQGIKKLKIKNEPGQGYTTTPIPKRKPKQEKVKEETKKKKSDADVIDTNTILGLLDEIDREDNDSAKTKDKKEEKAATIKETKGNVAAPRTSATSEDDDEALSKFISNKRKSSSKETAKRKSSSDTATKKVSRPFDIFAAVTPKENTPKPKPYVDPFAPVNKPKPYEDPFATPDEELPKSNDDPLATHEEKAPKPYVDPFATADEEKEPVISKPKQSENGQKKKVPVKISLKPLKKPTIDLNTDSERNPLEDSLEVTIDENNNIAPVDPEEKERFGDPIFDSLPLTSPIKDDSRLKKAQKYFKKGGPRHKFFS